MLHTHSMTSNFQAIEDQSLWRAHHVAKKLPATCIHILTVEHWRNMKIVQARRKYDETISIECSELTGTDEVGSEFQVKLHVKASHSCNKVLIDFKTQGLNYRLPRLKRKCSLLA
jgi:hypothetical protein